MAFSVDVQSQMRNMMQREHPLNLHRAMLLGLSTTPIEDPLKDFSEKDPVIEELHGDPTNVFGGYQKGCCLFTVACPCFIPHQIICCSPIGLYLVHSQVQKSAKANHLILHENCLVYRMDECAMPMAAPGQPTIMAPQACQTIKVYRVEFTMLLDEKIELEILPAHSDPCGKGFYPVETIVIKYENTLVASIDGPTDAAGFIEKFRQQREKAIANKVSAKLPAAIVDRHRAAMMLIGGMTGAGMAQMMTGGRGDPAAAMMAQQQFRNQFQMYEQRLREIEQQDSNRSASAPLVAEMVRDNNELNSMSVAGVSTMLTDLGLQEHSASFEKAGVDGAMLLVMDDETLKELGVSSALDRKKILAWVVRKKAASTSSLVHT